MEERSLVTVVGILPVFRIHKGSWHVCKKTSPRGPTRSKIQVWYAYLTYRFVSFSAHPQSYNGRFGVSLEKVACSVNFEHRAPLFFSDHYFPLSVSSNVSCIRDYHRDGLRAKQMTPAQQMTPALLAMVAKGRGKPSP